MTSPSASDYEDRLKLGGVAPNFFVSVPYMKAAQWTVVERAGLLEVLDSDAVLMLPPVDGIGTCVADRPWAGFPEYSGSGPGTFLDWQFVYDPTAVTGFQNVSSIFRRNVQRFERWHSGLCYKPADDPEVLLALFGAWLDEGETAQDADTIVSYLEAVSPERGAVLFENDQPIAFNAWDSNYRYVNFRYSFSVRGVKYLSEYVRWLFYHDAASLGGTEEVNDGGSLGSEGLRQFKLKLGPKAVLQINSWAT